MTLGEYVDETKLRLNRYNVVIDTNDVLIKGYINSGRRMAQRISLNYNKYNYGKIIIIPGNTLIESSTIKRFDNSKIKTYSCGLPDDLIEPTISTAVLTEPSKPSVYMECTHYNVEEYSAIGRSSWNIPMMGNPVFTVEHIISDNKNAPVKKFTIAGLNTLSDGNVFDLSKIVIYLHYIQTIPDLAAMKDVETFLTPDLQEYAIYQAMLACIRDMKATENYQTVTMDINRMVQSISASYQIQKVEDVTSLETNEIKV